MWFVRKRGEDNEDFTPPPGLLWGLSSCQYKDLLESRRWLYYHARAKFFFFFKFPRDSLWGGGCWCLMASDASVLNQMRRGAISFLFHLSFLEMRKAGKKKVFLLLHRGGQSKVDKPTGDAGEGASGETGKLKFATLSISANRGIFRSGPFILFDVPTICAILFALQVYHHTRIKLHWSKNLLFLPEPREKSNACLLWRISLCAQYGMLFCSTSVD